MTEVLIPMGAFRSFAAVNLDVGRLIKWHSTVDEITLCGSGERPVGIVVNGNAADEDGDEIIEAGSLCNGDGAVEFFKHAGVVRTTLDFSHTAGQEVESGSNGTIVAHTSGYAFGVVLDSGDSGEEARIYIY